jgi:hypothetical protein
MDGERPLCDLAEARRAMRFPEQAVDFLGHSIDRNALRPRRTRPRVTPLKHGDLRASATAALLDAGGWLTTAEIASRIYAARGLTLDAAGARHFRQKLREALGALDTRGFVERRHRVPLPLPTPAQEWRLAARWRRAA